VTLAPAENVDRADPALAEARAALLGVAVYAARVLTDTDGLWPPAARATACRRGLEHIEGECRRVHAAVTEGDDG
jgi:hypothetical protein